MIRIANGQGFWGDWLEAPVRLVEEGPIDFLVLDYLAEVTMSILQKQKQEDSKLGYARDFPPLIGRLAARLRERNIKVVANAGGVNPVACARAVLAAAPGLKVAVIRGDDVFHRIDEFLGKGYQMCATWIQTNPLTPFVPASSPPTPTSEPSPSPKRSIPARTSSSFTGLLH